LLRRDTIHLTTYGKSILWGTRQIAGSQSWPSADQAFCMLRELIGRVTRKMALKTRGIQDSWLFWFSLDKRQVPTKTALSLHLLSCTGKRKYDERLEGRDKDRERSLTNYCHGQNRLNSGRKGSLIRQKSNQSRIVRK